MIKICFGYATKGNLNIILSKNKATETGRMISLTWYRDYVRNVGDFFRAVELHVSSDGLGGDETWEWKDVEN